MIVSTTYELGVSIDISDMSEFIVFLQYIFFRFVIISRSSKPSGSACHADSAQPRERGVGGGKVGEVDRSIGSD